MPVIVAEAPYREEVAQLLKWLGQCGSRFRGSLECLDGPASFDVGPISLRLPMLVEVDIVQGKDSTRVKFLGERPEATWKGITKSINGLTATIDVVEIDVPFMIDPAIRLV